MSQIQDYLKYVNIQMAAEALWETSGDPEVVLKDGNGHASRFTAVQAEKFIADGWEMVSYQKSTETGFSGTLFHNKVTGENVLSFRSTEFIDDAARDNEATNALEIKEKGWAFGQIDDMRNWVKSLVEKNSSLIGNLTVTGYSLGGHLAAAFNQLFPGYAKATYTFNGAGVGIVKDSEVSGLGEVIDRFDRMWKNESGQEVSFSDSATQQAYLMLRAVYTGQTVPDLLTIDSLTRQNDSADMAVLVEALKRARKVLLEADRVRHLTDKNTPSNQNGGGPAKIQDSDIAAGSLDYQIAVLLASKYTEAKYSDPVAGGVAAFEGRHLAPGAPLPNWFDIYAAPAPSAVANSQLHYGTPTPIFIEDQPLYRGSIFSSAAIESFRYAEVKLLVEDYSKNDFGDTHSLVLLVDSLSVQDLLTRLDPTLTQTALNSIFAAASNAHAEAKSGTQGRAEGDVLENTISSLAQMLGIKLTPMSPSMEGGTWANKDKREIFHGNIKAINDNSNFGNLAGKILIRQGSLDLRAAARNDFGAIAALETLSPFWISANSAEAKPAVEAVWANAYGDRFAAWQEDRTSGKQATFTDMWIDDRSKLLNAVIARGQQNVETGVVQDPTVPADRTYRFEFITKKVPAGQADANTPGSDVPKVPVDTNELILARRVATQFLPQQQLIKFGGTGNDVVNGTDNVLGDHLYGGGGNDSISGGMGDDYLEGDEGDDTLIGGTGSDTLVGGKGFDSYIIDAQSGNDAIVDADGSGQIIFGGIQLTGAGHLQAQTASSTIWSETLSSGLEVRYYYNQLTKDLTVIGGSGSSVRVRNFEDGALGIKIPQSANAVERQQAAAVGDLSTNEGMNAYEQTLFPFEQVDGTYKKVPKDVSFRAENAKNAYSLRAIDTNGGDDVIVGGIKQDLGSKYGSASWHAGGGNDRIYLSNEVTLKQAIERSETESRIDAPALAIGGGAGDDEIYGDGTDSVIFGGDGSDTIVGGAGDNIIFADGDNGHSTQLSIFGMEGENDASSGQVRSLRARIKVASMKTGRDGLGGGLLEERYFDSSMMPLASINPLASIDFSDMMRMHGDDVRPYVDGYSNYFGYGDIHSAALTTNKYAGDDVVYAGAGNDVVNAGRGNDTVFGGSGNDAIAGYEGDDFIDGGDGDDLIYGDYVAHTDGLSVVNHNFFGGYNVVMKHVLDASQHGSDYLTGGAGNDYIFGGGGSDIVLGGDGNDVLYGDDIVLPGQYAGDDYIDGGDGDDKVVGGGGADYILGGAGNDYLVGDSLHDEAKWQGNDYIDGGDGDDELRGGGGADTLLGGNGNDTLIGDSTEDATPTLTSSNDDYLDGGAGDDLLQGQLGNDVLLGGEGNDRLYGDEGDDQLSGGAGNDVLHGGTGNDVLLGGDGDDSLYGDEGNDTLYASKGSDSLVGGSGTDRYVFSLGTAQSEMRDGVLQVHTVIDDADADSQIVFDAGIDLSSIKATETPDGKLIIQFGTDGAFVMTGGVNALGSVSFSDGTVIDGRDFVGKYLSTAREATGSYVEVRGSGSGDHLTGTGGAVVNGGLNDDLIDLSGSGNTVLYQAGDGVDLIRPDGGQYTIHFTNGLRAQDLVVEADGNDLILRFTGHAGDELRIEGAGGRPDLRPSTLQFGDQASISLSDFLASHRQSLIGTSGNDSLLAAPQLALAYDIQGGDGNDYLSGGDLDDSLSGGNGDDFLNGGSGNDTLIGGRGNDWLSDAFGANTFCFAAGDGSDQIDGINGDSVIAFDSSVGRSSLEISLEQGAGGWDVVIRYGNGDQIRVRNGFSLSDASVPSFAFAGIRLADGGFLSADEMLASLRGVQGNVTSGADALIGGGSDDVLDGAAGNDVLQGGGGHDIYRIGAGSGVDTIVDPGAGRESIEFGDGIRVEDLVARQVGSDLYVGTRDHSAGARIQGYFSNGQKTWNVTASGAAFDVQAALALPVTEVERLRNAFDERQYFDIAERMKANDAVEVYGQRSGISGRTAPWQYDRPGIITNSLTSKEVLLRDEASNPSGSESYADNGSVQETTSGVITRPDIQQVRVPGRIYAERNYYGRSGVRYPAGTTFFMLTFPDGITRRMVKEPDRWETRYNGTVTETWSNTTTNRVFDHHVELRHVVGDGTSETLILNPVDEYGNKGSIDFRGSVSAGAGDDVIDLSAARANERDWWTTPLGYSPSAVDVGYGAFIDGGDGNDTLIGTEGMDVLVGGTGNDMMAGGLGADTYWIGRSEGDADVIDDEGYVSPDFLEEANAYGGVFPSDVVEFGPDISVSDLTYALFERQDEPGTILRLFINKAQHVDILYNKLKQSEPGAVGIERFRFASGATFTTDQLLASIEPFPQIMRPVVNWASNFNENPWAVQDDAFSMAIPADLFMQIGKGGSVTVVQADGSPLPSWLQYDVATGVLSGQVPHGANTYALRIVAMDATGNQSVRNFTLNVNGDRTETVHQPDGSWQTTVQDMDGNRTTTYYAADGTRLRDEWTRTNGSRGTDTFSADGSTTRTSDAEATGHAVVTDDGQGHVTHTYQTTRSFQTLVGSGANDTFIVDHGGATIVEPAGGSNAVLQTSVNFTAPDGVDQIVLTGNGWQRVVGNGANDSFAVMGAAGSVAELQLGDGNNTVSGQDSDVTVYLGAGNNDLILGNGSNTVMVNRSQHSANAGDGSNKVYLGNGSNQVSLGDGNNTVGVGTGDNTITVGNGNNTLYAGHGAGTNTVTFGDGANAVTVGDGANTVVGGNGRDTIWGGNGGNHVTVGNGDDTIGLGNGGNVVSAGNGANSVSVGNGDNQITLGGGHNTVNTGSGANTVIAGDGGNAVYAGDGANTIKLGHSADTIGVGTGNNTIDAGGGDNTIYAGRGAGNNVVTASDGNNTIWLGAGSNQIVVGNGNNSIGVGSATGSRNTIQVGNGANAIEVGAGTNDIYVGNGTDTVKTGNGVNSLHLGTGQVTLTNYGGQDTVYLSSSVNEDQLWFAQEGNDLLVTVDGTSSSLRLTDWFNGATHATLMASDGHQLIDSQVASLVQAMAQLSPPPAGQTSLSPEQRESLTPVIASSWR
ncbi:hemolysin-type protein [Ralstonia pseudosolanacearum]|uniref:hemolysin-type protein n=1 Tax=Ralstonia pseudosolanacearum TaxID=1310165 RepID=UPI001FF95371|nr:hemolysin-type protein [Ralstonia pseudosolanacearum]